MGAQLAASVYAIAAIAVAYAISPEKSGPYRWIFVGWLAFILPNFMFPSPFLGLIIAAVILLLLPMRTRIQRAVLYTGMFCAMQPSLGYAVPFPGVNFLVVLNYSHIALFVLLLPILMWGRPRGEHGADTAVAVCFATFIALVTALSIRDLPFTSALRSGVNVTMLLLPALAISWSIRTREDYIAMIKALMILGLLFSVIGIVSQVIRWNFYSSLAAWHDFRWGMLRVSGTTYPVLAGMFGLVAFLVTLLGLGTLYTRSRLLLAQGAMLTLILFSFTRGVWIAGVAGLLVYGLLMSRTSNVSFMLICISGAVGGFILGTTLLLDFDPYGTFSYRAELLKAAQKQFWTAPLFGSPSYLESGNFDHLWTGFNLIDVVNYYVQVTMEYGLAGLVFYLAPFLIVMFGLVRHRVPRPRSDKQIEMNRMLALCFSLLSAHLTLIMTVSGVEFILHFGYLLLGLSMGAIKVAAEAKAKEPNAAVPELLNQQKPALRPPESDE